MLTTTNLKGVIMPRTETRIRELLDEKFGLPMDELTADGVTFEDLALDSLILVEFALVIRKELGVDIDAWELSPTLTIPAAAALVDAKSMLVVAEGVLV
jgi:acyl carrier protein